jgi:hypothetical protein
LVGPSKARSRPDYLFPRPGIAQTSLASLPTHPSAVLYMFRVRSPSLARSWKRLSVPWSLLFRASLDTLRTFHACSSETSKTLSHAGIFSARTDRIGTIRDFEALRPTQFAWWRLSLRCAAFRIAVAKSSPSHQRMPSKSLWGKRGLISPKAVSGQCTSRRRFAHRGTDQIRWYGVKRSWLFREFPKSLCSGRKRPRQFKLTFRLHFSLQFLPGTGWYVKLTAGGWG